MKHKNPGAPLHFLRFGTPRSSEIKRPTINIGDRQKNRLASQSVIPCSDSVKSLRQSISKAFSMIGDNNIRIL